MLKILIADDHPIIRKGLRQILLEEFSFVEIEEAGDCPELVRKALGSEWNIIVTDISMPGGGGIEALRQIKEKHPALPVLILSSLPEEQFALKMIKEGASGYLNKDAAPGQLIIVIRHILSGKTYIPEHLADKKVDDSESPPHEKLSEREWNVFLQLASGKSIAEISKLLSLRPNTVSTYRTRILLKMQMSTNVDLTRYALNHKLI